MEKIEFKGKEFNGSNGEFGFGRTHHLSEFTWYVITSNGRGPLIDVGGRDLAGQLAEAKFLVTDPKEIEANARLFANSKKVLEAAIKAHKAITYYEDMMWEQAGADESTRESLIKQSNILKELEKAITDSL